MIRKTTLAAILLSASMFAAKPNIVHDAEDFEQPGVLQFQGLTEEDQVHVDGELVPGKGLARMKYRLLVAPGEYVVTVKLADSLKECVSRVVVDAGRTVRPKCVRTVSSQMAD